ncbi:MAG TPA: hypothetical protein VI485_05785 [Vicinamibacterales bacterium]|nr:hypothetical protein [Vicinamibacterales bacterium]
MVGLLAVSVLSSTAATPQEGKLNELLARASAYVGQFVDQFSNVVAEETLLQEITVPRRKREIRSDFLLVRFPGDTQWLSFRDVAEVDGKPVRDKEERLTKLFLEPSRDAVRRAADISRAGARYNLLDIGTLNNPLLVLAFLQDYYQVRFRFNLAGIEKKLGPRVRTVQFQEFKTPTLIKGNSNADIMSRGLVWIDEETGRVVKTELRLGRQSAPISIITLFKFDEDLGINVPVEMRDWYPDGTGEIRGVATYGRFRRFQVKTDEEIGQK